eukprot:355569-Chlamydomonas_euryale.AAC.3
MQACFAKVTWPRRRLWTPEGSPRSCLSRRHRARSCGRSRRSQRRCSTSHRSSPRRWSGVPVGEDSDGERGGGEYAAVRCTGAYLWGETSRGERGEGNMLLLGAQVPTSGEKRRGGKGGPALEQC